MNDLTSPARVLLFDIEATDLEASFGHVLCFGYKYLGDKKTKVLSLKDFKTPPPFEEPDSNLLPAVHKILTDADIIVTYYGKGFDAKFLRTRMLMCGGLSPLPPLGPEHVDLYFCAKANLKLHSNRLQAVSESLGCPLSKTPIRADTWRRAQRGDPKAMRYVIEHCKLDVDVLEWCYMKLRPYVRQHPHIGERTACRVCGSRAAHNRGFTVSKQGGRQRRKQCQDCGAWRCEKVGT